MVIGGGPNGLVAAIALADAGWDVVLVEANDEVGGAVRSAEVTEPGFLSDLFSAFYPLAAGSPVIRDLELEKHGLEWCHAPAVVAHQFDDGRSAVVHHDVDTSAASVEAFAPGEGDAWRSMFADWMRVRDPLLDALFTPFPPVRSTLRMAATLRTAGLLDLARLAVLPVRRLGEEQFSGAGARALITGNAMHADIPPDAGGSGVFGWLLCMLGQDVGFPVPRGGAGMLAAALRRRFESAGGQVRTGARAVKVDVAGGRASAVRLADGSRIAVRRAVLADVDAPGLYRDLVGTDRLSPQVRDRLDRFAWDNATLKINWALSSTPQWHGSGAAGAGTVHLGVDVDGFIEFAADLSLRRAPKRPFCLFGQMTTADAARSPAGTESAWAYTHLPHAVARDDEVLRTQVERVEDALERATPGFRELVRARHVQRPGDLYDSDGNLVEGALNGGTASIHQQLVFRPFPGLGRPETPIPGLYLASASAHPGGGVHGACGWNAARSALAADGRRGAVKRALIRTAWHRVLGTDDPLR
ncbi:MAG: phytoene desaturase family protein [Marmoricola sp.]